MRRIAQSRAGVEWGGVLARSDHSSAPAGGAQAPVSASRAGPVQVGVHHRSSARVVVPVTHMKKERLLIWSGSIAPRFLRVANEHVVARHNYLREVLHLMAEKARALSCHSRRVGTSESIERNECLSATTAYNLLRIRSHPSEQDTVSPVNDQFAACGIDSSHR